MKFELVKPELEFLPEYKAALERDWSPTMCEVPQPRERNWKRSRRIPRRSWR
jgi:hypothetical protein